MNSGNEHKVTLTETAFVGFAWAVSNNGSQMILKIGVLAVLARLLTPADFGVASAALVIINLADIFGQLGVAPAIVQRRDIEEKHIETGFVLSIALGLLAGAIIYLLSNPIEAAFRIHGLSAVVKVLALTFPLRSLGIVADALLQRQFRFAAISAIGIAGFVAGYAVVAITLAALGWGVWSLVCGALAQTFLTALGTYLIARHPIRLALDMPIAGQLLRFGLTLTVARLANFLALNIDNIVVGRWLSAGALGLYSRGFQIVAQLANLFGAVVDRVLFPAMSSVQLENDRLAKAYDNSVGLVAMCTMPVSAVFIALAPEVIRLLLGPQWSGVVAPFQFLVAGLAFRSGCMMTDTLWRAKGALSGGALRQWLYVAEAASGAWIGHFWGIAGVAAGITAAAGVHYIVLILFVRSLIPISLPHIALTHLRFLALTVLVYSATWGCAAASRASALPALVTLGVGSIVAAAVFALLWMSLPSLFGKERELLVATLTKIRVRRSRAVGASFRQTD